MVANWIKKTWSWVFGPNDPTDDILTEQEVMEDAPDAPESPQMDDLPDGGEMTLEELGFNEDDLPPLDITPEAVPEPIVDSAPSVIDTRESVDVGNLSEEFRQYREQPEMLPDAAASTPGFWAILINRVPTGIVTSNGTPTQWTYQAMRVIKTKPGYSYTMGVGEDFNLWSFQLPVLTAYNGAENSVSPDHLSGGMEASFLDIDGDGHDEFWPHYAPGGTVVWLRPVPVIDPEANAGAEPVIEYWFTLPLSLEGGCDE